MAGVTGAGGTTTATAACATASRSTWTRSSARTSGEAPHASHAARVQAGCGDRAPGAGRWLFEDIDTVNVRCLNEDEGRYRAP